jgi:quercetin dioxygenase-like cupin family protein
MYRLRTTAIPSPKTTIATTASVLSVNSWMISATERATRSRRIPSAGCMSPVLPVRRGVQAVRRYAAAVAFQVVLPEALRWITRPHEPGEPARHVAELSETAGFAHTRANLWRYEPGARGRRHRHPVQEETFVVLAGELTMYLGEPAERHDVPVGGLIHVAPGTPLQTVNHGAADLLVYVYGTPPEDEHAELLASAPVDGA